MNPAVIQLLVALVDLLRTVATATDPDLVMRKAKAAAAKEVVRQTANKALAAGK